MKIAIIGSNGLLSDQIGSFCAERGDTISVYGIDAPKKYKHNEFHCVNLIQQEINIEKLVQNDIVIYAAGAGIQSNLNENCEAIYSLNTFLPIKLCKALALWSYKGTFVTFGSCFEIGANGHERLFSEDELANSILPVPNDYSTSKRLLTRFVRSNIAINNHLHLILPTIYGPTEAPHRLIPYTLSIIDKGETPKFTAGTQVRQYLYIGDVPNIVFNLASKAANGVFNIGGTQRLTVKELIHGLYAQRNRQIPEGVFGTVKRADVSMENLQLNDQKLRAVIPDIEFTPLAEVLPLYQSTPYVSTI